MQSLQLRSCFLSHVLPCGSTRCLDTAATPPFTHTGNRHVTTSVIRLLCQHSPSATPVEQRQSRTKVRNPFRHERRLCEASTIRGHAFRRKTVDQPRTPSPSPLTLVRYPSYEQRTSTTLPPCGKQNFLKPQHTCVCHADRMSHHYTV